MSPLPGPLPTALTTPVSPITAPSAPLRTPVTTPAIELRGVRKEYPGGVVAVDDLDLVVGDGEFLTLLGPSGSGKTTVLRMVAGFEMPTAGTVLLGGRDVTATAPFDRDVHTVFQDYALFPHLSVLRNVEYPLRIAGVGRTERRERARAALASVRLVGVEDRPPTALSGGQRQRVALARALVDRPALLLLDEPLGALDLELREQMQVELAQLQRESGITFVLVTHDQDEALTLADRVVVFHAGRVAQLGSAREVYERPTSEFVAGFLGTSNVLTDDVVGREGLWSVRPERITLTTQAPAPDPDRTQVVGVVDEVVYAGATTRTVVRLADGRAVSVVQLNTADLPPSPARDQSVHLGWRRTDEVRVQ